jgi:hypothetical protein
VPAASDVTALAAAAAVLPGPVAAAAAAQSEVNTAAAQMHAEDGLDIDDIFAFMK